MLKLNQKGQASSTFQLLIAAIVALAILGVLLTVLDIIPKPDTIPSNATKTLLTTQMTNPGAEGCTGNVTFTKANSKIATEGITANQGVDSQQLYFDNPEAIANFDTTSSQILKYTSTSSKKVVMCIICSTDKTNLEAAINLNKRTADVFSQIPNVPDNQTICVAYPRKTA